MGAFNWILVAAVLASAMLSFYASAQERFFSAGVISREWSYLKHAIHYFTGGLILGTPYLLAVTALLVARRSDFVKIVALVLIGGTAYFCIDSLHMKGPDGKGVFLLLAFVISWLCAAGFVPPIVMRYGKNDETTDRAG